MSIIHDPFSHFIKASEQLNSAGIGEMLLQSYLGGIHLLPALPDEWAEGTMKGLKAR